MHSQKRKEARPSSFSVPASELSLPPLHPASKPGGVRAESNEVAACLPFSLFFSSCARLPQNSMGPPSRANIGQKEI